jgi:large subunit ribosomal protein L28e
MATTISHDLAWEVTKGRSSTLVKRANGVQFSRDPLNLRNVYSRKNEGSIANKVRPQRTANAPRACVN